MKAVVFNAPNDIAVKDVPQPSAGPGQVLVQVAAAGICGTDLRIQVGGFYAIYPLIPGHEFSGTVAEVGAGVTSLAVGDWVAINPNTPCRRCGFCRVGSFHLCPDMTSCGVTYSGGFAEYCTVAEELALPVPRTMPLELWAMMEPTSCCLHGIDLVGITPGDSVVILGGGSIGLILMQLARAAGAAQVIVSEPKAEKRELAEELGADATVDPLEVGEGLTDAIRDLTDGGAHIVIEAAGNPATAAAAIPLARRGGKVMFFGVTSQDLVLPIKPYDIYHNELTILGSFTNPLTDSRAISMLASKRVQVEPLTSHRYGLDEVEEGLAAVRRGETVKALVTLR